jgi:hypothetical protein
MESSGPDDQKFQKVSSLFNDSLSGQGMLC